MSLKSFENLIHKNVKSVLWEAGIHEERHIGDIRAIYPYGSRVYGINSETSDYDYWVIHNGYGMGSLQFPNVDIHLLSMEDMQNQINGHEISALECLFSTPIKEDLLWEEGDTIRREWLFTLKKDVLRSSISAKASNSWVKCKKKLADGENYIGLKSLFHSLRILMFGKQLAEHGRIINFQEANHFYSDIMNKASWKECQEAYQSTYNQLHSEFRILAPKSIPAPSSMP